MKRPSPGTHCPAVWPSATTTARTPTYYYPFLLQPGSGLTH
jgi:hypothetical protein